MVRRHDHTCARCGFTWDCRLVQKPKAKHCPVDLAVKVNKTGPVCLLCLHLGMAARVAVGRGLTDEAFTDAVARCWVEAKD